MKFRLKLPQELYQEILNLLRFNDEQAGFILAGYTKRRGSLTLLGRKVIICLHRQLKSNSQAHVEIARDFAKRVLTTCRNERFCLIHFHTHPFSSANVTFSSIDDACDREFFPYVAKRIPGIYHGSLVVGHRDLNARIYEKDLHRTSPMSEIIVVGEKLKKIIPSSARKGADRKMCLKDFFDRQVRLLGEAGQRMPWDLCCGIVGLGGTGSLIFEALLRLGVGKIILIDPDRIEASNLNRVIQASWEDVKARRFKVEIMKRKARRINRKTRVIALKSSILERSSQLALKGADVIFGAVDNDLARLILTQQAAKYLIPLIDVGTGINVDKEGKIQDFAGQVYVFIPGRSPCLVCLDAIDMREVNLSLMSAEDKKRQRQYGYISGEDIVAPAVLPLNMELVSFALIEFMNLVFGFRKVNNYVFYDGLSEEKIAYAIKVKPESGCTICSPRGLLAKGDLARFENLFKVRPSKDVPRAEATVNKRETTRNNTKGGTNG